MRKDWELSQEAFDLLLDWLDPADRERAGQKYESVRRRLIEIFASRGCRDAEDLSDETINRVTQKLPGLSGGYTGDPALYFYGVAQKVYLEHLRWKPTLPLPAAPPPAVAPPPDEEEREADLECLEECLRKLPPANRDLFLRYYADEEKGRDRRKRLAGSLGVSFNALRIRAHRVREALRACVRECLARAGTEIS